MTPKAYNQDPIKEIKATHKTISFFEIPKKNIDDIVVNSFGEEWNKFQQFDENDIDTISRMYFDIVNEKMINKDSYIVDLGCGTGRFSKFLSKKAGFIESIDPSEAVFAADNLLKQCDNVRITGASIDNIPFDDETFDFGMSIGVLHHIPNTQKALQDCVKKVKLGGYFYLYLYYKLDNKGLAFKSVYYFVDLIRKITSRMPSSLKKLTCDALAVLLYMPIILLGRFLRILRLNKVASSLPLSAYQDKSFFVIRNDSLDRFGTTLEQRFTRLEIQEMMTSAGLGEIVFSEKEPYWHAVGKRIM